MTDVNKALVEALKELEAAAAQGTGPSDAPWQPPEDRPYNYECLGWIYEDWDFVFWVGDHWQTRKGNRCRPTDFWPMPPSSKERA